MVKNKTKIKIKIGTHIYLIFEHCSNGVKQFKMNIQYIIKL